MPLSYVNPYNGQEEETCSVSFASQAHVASVHDAQTEAQFNKAKLLGEWGIIKAKLDKGEIPNGTKVLTYEATNFKGYFVVKQGVLKVVQYIGDNKRYELNADATLVEAIMDNQAVKLSIPKAVRPAGQPQAGVIEAITGWSPDTPINNYLYWSKLNKAEKDGKLPKGTVVAVNPDSQARIVYVGKREGQPEKYLLQGADDNGDWTTIDKLFYPHDAEETIPEGWFSPAEGHQSSSGGSVDAPPPLVAPAGAALTQAEKNGLKNKPFTDGEVVAHASSNAGAGKYRLVYQDGGWFLVQRWANENGGWWKTIDKDKDPGDLLDDGNKWYLGSDEPVAAPTPKPPVSQTSTSTGSMTDEDVAILFVKTKDELAKEKGLNIKGSNPELDALVHKEIGDKIGYTPAEVKAKIEAYKATGKKLSALKKKVLKNKDQPTPAPTPVNPDPVPMPNNVPTAATNDVFEELMADVGTAVDEAPNVVHSDEDVAAAYIIAKDKIVAASNGKWTLYTKNDDFDKEIFDEVKAKTGLKMADAKHQIALYLSDPKNKLSKLKKSLIKQGKMKAEADTLKKKPTPAEVLTELNTNADNGYTPEGTNNPDAPIPDAPFEPRAKPPINDLTYTGVEVGTHHAQIWTDKDGNQWLFKKQEAFLNAIDVGTAKLAKKIGHPAADTYEVTLNGKTGSLQRMFPGGDAFPSGLNPESAPTASILAVQKEHVLDWLFANHDNHDKNYVLDEHGNIVGIDKGQALKFLGMDKLHWTFFPNQFEPAPNKLYKAFAEGKNVALNNPNEGELKDFIEKVMSIDDNELKEMFRAYAEGAKAKGSLATGQPHWKPQALGPKTIPVNDVEAFLDAIVKRKNNLDKDFAKLWDDAKKERAKHVPDTDVSAPVTTVADEPGDISHIPENVKETFKSHVGTLFAADTPASIYEKLDKGVKAFKSDIYNGTPQQALGKMSILQAVRIMDELKAKKANVPNGHLYEKKLVEWLTSPEGKDYFQKQKDKEEALKKVEQMKAAQPDLPADSALFKDIELEEVRQWQSEQTPWTAGQEASLKHYTSNQGYTEMNGNLRQQGYQNDRVDKHVKDARAGMRPLDRHIIAHRGTTAISFGLADNGSENDLLYSLVGTTHKQIGFSSASYGSKAGFGSKPVIIHFEIPPGAPAAFVRDISYYKHSTENEILLDHGYEVRVLRVWETGSGWSRQFHIQVRVESWEGKE